MGKFVYHSVKRFQFKLTGALAAVLLFAAACQNERSDYSILLGGDVILARGGTAIFQLDDQPLDPWIRLQATGEVLDFSSAQPVLFGVNLESPLGMIPASIGDMNLCTDASEGNTLMDGGVNLVTLANNHQNDCQANGAANTRRIVEKYGLLSATNDLQPVWFAVPPGRIAVLAADDVTGSLDEVAFAREITEAKKTADLVLVSIHWGHEYQVGPTERQIHLAQVFADAGADVIWGQHPHVLQRMQWINSADGRKVLVLYSLGNLLSDQWMLEDARRSALVQLEFSGMSIKGIEVYPIWMDRETKSLYPVMDQNQAQIIADRLGLEDLTHQNESIEVKLH